MLGCKCWPCAMEIIKLEVLIHGSFPSKDKDSYAKTPFSVWDLIPASYNCPMDVERIGRMGDGGKWVCGMSQYEKNKKPCVLYSFGVTNETSFGIHFPVLSKIFE
jgi:hypothetical protein